MTYDGNNVMLYLNNRLVKNDTNCCHGNILSRSLALVIGDATDDAFLTFAGIHNMIDEVYIFKKALTAAQVASLYQTLTYKETTAKPTAKQQIDVNNSSGRVQSVIFLILPIFVAFQFS